MTAFVAWLIRALVVLLVIRFFVRLLFNVRPQNPARRDARPVERSGGRLVRDPQCGTYLPVDRAIRIGSGESARYFCSTACRDSYRAAHSAAS